MQPALPPPVEVNFDGLVGPTHNYAGLSFGNVASRTYQGQVSNPRAAALQGIAKMRLLMDLGLPQGVLAPQPRPDMALLARFGFVGRVDSAVYEQAWAQAPELMLAMLSASSMWAANAATVSPSADCADGRLHFSVANLVSKRHRAFEAAWTEKLLRTVFADPARFCVHSALFGHDSFADEGAANHMRLSPRADQPGVEVFVFGREEGEPRRTHFPARQTRAAGEAIARRHGLDPARTVFIRQAARAIDAGAFHNDVVAVAQLGCVFAHEQAFEDAGAAETVIRAAADFAVVFETVPAGAVSLDDAIASYLFNSQLIARPGANRLTLIAPQESAETASTAAYLAGLVQAGGPIGEVRHVDLRESMRNGGGPACLRLRVDMNGAEQVAASPFLSTPALLGALEDWIQRWYRDRLSLEDLRDPAFLDETRAALDALTAILPLGAGYYEGL
jgi:succinylarginine dihydrolase